MILRNPSRNPAGRAENHRTRVNPQSIELKYCADTVPKACEHRLGPTAHLPTNLDLYSGLHTVRDGTSESTSTPSSIRLRSRGLFQCKSYQDKGTEVNGYVTLFACTSCLSHTTEPSIQTELSQALCTFRPLAFFQSVFQTIGE